MNKRINKRTKIIFSIIIVTVLCIILHQFAPEIATENLSVFHKNGLFAPLLTIFLFLSFGHLAIVYQMIRKDLTGKPFQKGLKFGLPFSFLWISAFFGGTIVFSSTFYSDFIHSTADGIAIVLTSIILAVYINKDEEFIEIKYNNPICIPVITLFFLIGRYLSFSLINIQFTLLIAFWICLVGICVGLI